MVFAVLRLDTVVAFVRHALVAGVVGAVDAPAAGLVDVELQTWHAVLGHVQAVGDLEGLLVRAVEVRQQGVGQVDAVGFVQVVEVLVTVHFLVREGQGVGLVGQAERQGVGVVVDVADQRFAFFLCLVVVQAGGQAQHLAVAQHVSGAEVVLVPDVFSLGGPEAGGQAGEWGVGDTAGIDVIGFNDAVGVFGAEFALAFFGTRRVAIEGSQVELQVVQLFAVDRYTLEARRQRTVTDDVDHRAAEVLATGGQGGVGNTRLDVGQAQLAPLANGVAAFFGQGTVVARAWASARCAAVVGRQVLAVLVQGDGVVGRHFSADTDSAFGEARVVLDDGALDPVDTTVSRGRDAVFLVGEIGTTFQLFIGVPVTGRAADRLAFEETGGFALGAFFIHGHRGVRLALGFSVRRGGYAADGQGQYRGAAQFHG
ncbi:hypothetical protein D3C76_857070 [compost metagenome]